MKTKRKNEMLNKVIRNKVFSGLSILLSSKLQCRWAGNDTAIPHCTQPQNVTSNANNTNNNLK